MIRGTGFTAKGEVDAASRMVVIGWKQGARRCRDEVAGYLSAHSVTCTCWQFLYPAELHKGWAASCACIVSMHIQQVHHQVVSACCAVHNIPAFHFHMQAPDSILHAVGSSIASVIIFRVYSGTERDEGQA
jgi:hypothetical protein